MSIKSGTVELISELLKPNECYLIEMDDDGILYLGNNNGRAFLDKATFPKEMSG